MTPASVLWFLVCWMIGSIVSAWVFGRRWNFSDDLIVPAILLLCAWLVWGVRS